MQALTTHRDAHVRGARLDGGRIVYQLGAYIYLYDTASASEHRLAIELDSDFVQRRERFIGLLEWLAALGNAAGMAEWTRDSNAARILAGRLRNDQA